MRLAVTKYNALRRDIKLAEILGNNTALESKKLIDIFNEKEMLNLNIQFRYIIQPAYESINDNLSNLLESYCLIQVILKRSPDTEIDKKQKSYKNREYS